MDLHNAQVEELGVFRHKLGYLRGMSEGLPPLKSVTSVGQHPSHHIINDADINAWIQAEVERQVAEVSDAKEYEFETKLWAELDAFLKKKKLSFEKNTW